ncbi:hypothetical protein EBB59_04150 [Lysobacter pythonis]|uniref:Uncharacterized protein n=1 Tax=Solilutibacter pythonis TaxID=2483112 RepID=A0A3M2I1K6_9GAMM|nr:hypothetical protein [Lysobacter pythonis]RMH93840.1 hypothetical protein EBB59_04150 [Lysobacter pythonis]
MASVARRLTARAAIFHRAEFGASRENPGRMTDGDACEVGVSGNRYARVCALLDALERRHASALRGDCAEHGRIAAGTYLAACQLKRVGNRSTWRAAPWRDSPMGWKNRYRHGPPTSERRHVAATG